MKINILSLSALLISASLFTGCLKDNGFENQQYGIKDPSGGSLGISIPEAVSQNKSLSIDASASPQTLELFDINLESSEPAASDIHVNLVLNPTLIANYNTANGTSAIAFTSAQYTTNLKVTIPKGSRLGTAKIVVTNATNLVLSQTYALGFSIGSIDEAGYTIASNLKSMLILVNIKNQWDGRYQLKGNFVHPTIPTYGGPVTVNNFIELRTSGPNSVALYWANPSVQDYVQPWLNGSSLTWYGGWGPNFSISATNAITVTSYQGAAATQTLFNMPGYNSRYDPATKTLYAQFAYNTTAPRVFTDTLKYLGPR